MTSPSGEVEAEFVIRESMGDYLTCTAHLPPIMRWHDSPVCGAMVSTREKVLPIECPACGSRVL